MIEPHVFNEEETEMLNLGYGVVVDNKYVVYKANPDGSCPKHISCYTETLAETPPVLTKDKEIETEVKRLVDDMIMRFR